ncbi:Uncharacterized 2Fe-2 and 4Fe-4S clusters-containing protein, contains DUF4445 domain [Sporobacter termitidis DSM 10068]|uniref:Uncharacterized 2Fe-2 and 4Fe-4S clusters-containing protein, contains DUF4445 domain n=1 Tax=Sporobacter termitidis DSM 10068 TaxID=1123282 RepID=A0A1M5Z7B9_9FIRM|nr:ASKHA domain-containing protein [Sporobacter termitidis]SHI20146.1 Uncharacterized 2Fe-2 and 4Fe-4S clusters-containing protein, contains DUF4445 domain [Sporobacter termitidis DSM 10068]
MSPVLKIYRGGKLIHTAEAVPGETLYERIIASDIYLEAPCGGRGKCGKCLVQLSPDGPKVRACQTQVSGDMDVYLPEEMHMKIAGDDAKSKTVTYTGPLGIAVDIGTTTVVAHLTDIPNCTRLATASGVNAQRTYGADVISRIQYCAENGHEVLTRVIRAQLAGLISKACKSVGANPKDIHYISIAGNTIMQHLAAGYSPVAMGVAPFTPVELFGNERPAGKDLPVADDAVLYFAPCVYSYVGGDITAGMLASDLENIKGNCVYIDIGTNGELVLKADDRYYCCATAAGPAFEGAEIAKGMAAIQGAISHVKWSAEKGLELTVIGDAAPEGLCGSGLMDALAVMVSTSAVDETGRLVDAGELEHHPISRYLGKREGKNVFWLSKEHDVYMIPGDVRKLQLAKAAIAAGIQTLLHTAGKTNKDISGFLLAGGFGSFLDQHSAATIGLFPKDFLPFARTMGNTAGEGAALALCTQAARDTLKNMMDNFEVVELSTSKIFNEQFIDQMMFEG